MSKTSPFLRYQEFQVYVGWTEEDAKRVQSLAPIVTPYFEALIADFYAEVDRHPETRRILTGGPEQIQRLKVGLHHWLTQLFSGQYDAEYVESRWRVGYRHVEIGLNQAYANTSLSRLRHRLYSLLGRHWQGGTDELLAARSSLNTLIDLDLTLLQDAYQTEFQRRHREAERLATIGKIAGGIAHELRNPLNVVKTSVYYLLHAKSLSPEKTRSHLERINRQVEAANDVITALNDFAKLPMPHIDPVRIADCIHEALELNPMPSNIAVVCHVESPTMAVLGDRAQLQIALGNLLRNARDAMPNGGVLRLTAVSDGKQVVISVQDTGSGIAPEHLSQVLEPLYTTKAKGIGLGLPISHDIVQRHQGTLTVCSQVGVGSTFTIRLNTFLGAMEAN